MEFGQKKVNVSLLDQITRCITENSAHSVSDSTYIYHIYALVLNAIYCLLKQESRPEHDFTLDTRRNIN